MTFECLLSLLSDGMATWIKVHSAPITSIVISKVSGCLVDMALPVCLSVHWADLTTEWERQWSTVRGFRCSIFRCTIGQASCLIGVCRRQLRFGFCC